MSSNFNFYVNRQGVQGKRGAKGEQGFSPVISVESQTANEYILKVENEDGSFFSPNLRGNAIENNGGTYIRFNPETEQMYTGYADGATTEQAGVVRMGVYEDLVAGESEELVPNVADVHDFVQNSIGDISGFVTTEQFNTYTSNTAITLNNLSNNKLDASTFDSYASTTDSALESLSTNKLNASTFDSFANSTSLALNALNTEKLNFTDLANSLVEGSNVTLTKDTVNKIITISSSGGATQVQSDWAETDNTDPSFIQNKPTLGTMAAEDASDYTPTTGLSEVAISGSYDDLLDKPTLFSGDYDDLTNKPVLGTMASEEASDYTPTANLAEVATTGDYDDLINKPTIPAAQVQSDWNQSDNTAVDFIKNKPTIPAAANNATITITQGGVTKGSFTTNQSTDETIDIDVGGGSSLSAGNGIDINSSDEIDIMQEDETETSGYSWEVTKVGSPTNNNGVWSNFSNSNYLTIPANTETITSLEWNITFTPNSNSGIQDICGHTQYCCWIQNRNGTCEVYTWNGMSPSSHSFNGSLSTGVSYTVNLVWNGTNATAKLYNNDTSTLIQTLTWQTSGITWDTTFQIGKNLGNNNFNGSIDLNNSYIKVNGNLVSSISENQVVLKLMAQLLL